MKSTTHLFFNKEVNFENLSSQKKNSEKKQNI